MAVPFLTFELVSGNSITDYYTYDSWGLIPDGRLIVNPPDVRENYIEIPGRNGELDLSEIQTGSVQLKNRTGSWDFFIVPYGYASISGGTARGFPGNAFSTAMLNTTPAQMAQTIFGILHGKTVKVWLDDDLNHYYSGRVKIKSWPPGKTYSKITIDYNLAPNTLSGSPTASPSQGGGGHSA